MQPTASCGPSGKLPQRRQILCHFAAGIRDVPRAGFMFAGASRIVSSLWNVDDRASALLMSRFYTEMLTKHLPPAAALHAAQLSRLREPRWANPHYWAAFGLHGEWQ